MAFLFCYHRSGKTYVYQPATLTTSVTPVAWSNGVLFDGYVLILLAMPSGYSGTSAFLQGMNPVRPIAKRWRFWIANGAIDGGSTIPYSSSIEPPNTQYIAFWYDLNDVLIAQGTSLFTVAASPYVLPVPTLAAPTTPVSIPYPTGTTPTWNLGFIGNEVPSGMLDGTNASFTLVNNPVPANSLMLVRNSIVQQPGVNYTLSGNVVTFQAGYIPQSGDALAASYQYNAPFNQISGFADSETPSGAVNGTNNTFTLAYTPSSTNGLVLTRNGASAMLNEAFTISGATITFLAGHIPQTGDVLKAWYRYQLVTGFSEAETPSGTINGTNVTFTLTNTPNVAASLMLLRNGIMQIQGTQYTLAGSTITFQSGHVPQTGDWLRAWYRF